MDAKLNEWITLKWQIDETWRRSQFAGFESPHSAGAMLRSCVSINGKMKAGMKLFRNEPEYPVYRKKLSRLCRRWRKRVMHHNACSIPRVRHDVNTGEEIGPSKVPVPQSV